MRIGFVQFEPRLGDRQSTLNAVERLLTLGAEADLLVLPELSNSGYNFSTREQALRAAESTDTGPFVNLIQSACQRYKMHIVCGFNELHGDSLFNTALLVGPEGIVGKYRKLHLFMNEKDIFDPGDLGLPVFEVGDCRIGMLICFDWLFPEAWRVLALNGADIICHPSNLVIPGLAQRAVPVHAITNRVFVITANRIGTEGDYTFTGRSIIADPAGNPLAEASPSDEEVKTVVVNIELARNKMITPRNHAFNDRRPEAYKRLTDH